MSPDRGVHLFAQPAREGATLFGDDVLFREPGLALLTNRAAHLSALCHLGSRITRYTNSDSRGYEGFRRCHHSEWDSDGFESINCSRDDRYSSSSCWDDLLLASNRWFLRPEARLDFLHSLVRDHHAGLLLCCLQAIRFQPRRPNFECTGNDGRQHYPAFTFCCSPTSVSLPVFTS